MARVKIQQEHICPNCNVRVLSEAAVVEVPGQDEPLCVICAPYDPEREDVAILLLHDAAQDVLQRASMGALKSETTRIPFTNVVIRPEEIERTLDLNDFIRGLFDVYYEDAFPGSARARLRDGVKGIIDQVDEILLKHDEEGRKGSVIIPKELTDRYIASLDILHAHYVSVHRKYIESERDLEAARVRSYDAFWHIGALIRNGELARRPAPWTTGESQPRF
jgi:hypothetical protein